MAPSHKKILTLALCILLCQYHVLAAIINTTPTPTAARTTLTTTSTTGASSSGANAVPVAATNTTRPLAGATVSAATQPAFNFNFGSMFDRTSAQSAVTQTRSSWDNFFTERPKPVFT